MKNYRWYWIQKYWARNVFNMLAQCRFNSAHSVSSWKACMHASLLNSHRYQSSGLHNSVGRKGSHGGPTAPPHSRRVFFLSILLLFCGAGIWRSVLYPLWISRYSCNTALQHWTHHWWHRCWSVTHFIIGSIFLIFISLLSSLLKYTCRVIYLL